MARSKNDRRNNTTWTEDRRAKRHMKGQETKNARKNERQFIARSMRGDFQ